MIGQHNKKLRERCLAVKRSGMLLAAGMGLCLLAGTILSQETPRLLEIKGFKVTENYEPPHELQLKTVLEGDRAQPQEGGRTAITQARIQTFSEKGEPELVLEAPQCMYDSGQHTVNSSGPLRVRTADGKFFTEGEGFLWQQGESSLLISNKVHTTVKSANLQTGSTNSGGFMEQRIAQDIDVVADHFKYTQKNGEGVYRDNVRATGTNLTLTSGLLTVNVPVKERRLQTLVAEENAVFDYTNVNHIHTVGQRAVYTADTGTIRVTGEPSWSAEQRKGGGNELLLEPSNSLFRVTGDAWLEMPAKGAGASTFLPRTPSPQRTSAQNESNAVVRIQSGNYDLRTNSALFTQSVKLSERSGDVVKGTMDCGQLALAFVGTNELQSMVAQHAVVIAQGETFLKGEQAVYAGSNGLMDLTGHPEWHAGLREGKGQRITLDTRQNRMLVRTNASMRLPASELTPQTVTGLGLKGKKNENPAESSMAMQAGGTNDFAEIYSEEYVLQETNAVFKGGVYITHTNTHWECETLTAQFPPEGGRVERIVAEQDVSFDLVSEQGQKVHGTGDRAVYTFLVSKGITNNLVRLTGAPAVLRTTNVVVTNKLLLLDLGKDTLNAPGNFKVQAVVAEADTNHFQLPKHTLFRSKKWKEPTQQ